MTRRHRRFWHVIAVDNRGRAFALCGHAHRSKNAATSCRWEPDPWPDRSDLLVREVPR